MKTTTYTASTMVGARSMARQDGNAGEPLRSLWLSGQWHLVYPAHSRAATLPALRMARLGRWLAGFRRRAVVDTQQKIMRELSHG